MWLKKGGIHLNNRIKELRKHLGLTMEDFGKRLGVGKSTISNIENDSNRNVTDQMKKSIIREFDVSEDWLLYGKGEMFVTHSHDEEVAMYTQDILDDEESEMAKLIKNFIVTYSKLDDDSKSVLRKFAKDLLDAQNKEGETH